MVFKWVSSFLVSFILTKVIIVCARNFKFIHPISNFVPHQHKAGISSLGGIAIFTSFMIMRLFNDTLGLSSEIYHSYYVGTLCFLVGLVDDLVKINTGRNSGLPKIWKLLALVIFLLPYFIWVLNDPLLAVKFTSVIIFAAATIDVVDGLDGLAAITTIIPLAILGGSIAISLCGSILGFLYFNLKPAKIFMGDSGAMFIGSIIGCLLLGSELHPKVIYLFVIPILEVASVILKFILVKCKLNHKFFVAPIHHDLERRFGETITTILLTLCNLSIGILVVQNIF